MGFIVTASVNFGIIHPALIGMTDDEYHRQTIGDNLRECSTYKGIFPDLNSVDVVDMMHFDFQKNLPILQNSH